MEKQKKQVLQICYNCKKHDGTFADKKDSMFTCKKCAGLPIDPEKIQSHLDEIKDSKEAAYLVNEVEWCRLCDDPGKCMCPVCIQCGIVFPNCQCQDFEIQHARQLYVANYRDLARLRRLRRHARIRRVQENGE